MEKTIPQYPRFKQGEIDSIHEKLNKKNKKLISDFVNYCAITTTYKPKLKNIGKIIVQISHVTKKDLYNLSKDDIDNFVRILNHSDLSKWTRKEIKVYLKKFVLWYYQDLKRVENIKTTKKERDKDAASVEEKQLITEKDIEKMLRFAESYRDKAFLFLSFETGARPKTILDLKWKDIDDLKKKFPLIKLYCTKNNKKVDYPLFNSKQHLWNWKQHYSFPNVSDDDLMFPNPKIRNKPLTSAGLNKILRKMAGKAGLKKDIWNYLLRHSRGNVLYSKLPEKIAEKLLTHVGMSKFYANISNQDARNAVISKIYKVDELPDNEKQKMQKQIDNLKKEINMMNQTFAPLLEAMNKNPKTFDKLMASS